jgi:hypothetical protein
VASQTLHLNGRSPRVGRLHVVVQEATALEALAAVYAHIPFVVEVRRPFVRLQVGSLRERRPAHFALVGPLPCVGALVVPDLGLPGERLVADLADERSVPRVHDRVHLQVVRRTEPLPAEVTAELLNSRVGPFVLDQVLLAQESLGTLRASEWPRAHLMRLLVRPERVLRGEVLAALLAHVRPHPRVRIDVLLEQVPAAVLLAAGVTRPRLVLGVVHAPVDTEQAQVAEDAVAHLALEVALFGGHVLVQMGRQLVPLAEVLATHVADVQSDVVGGLHVGGDGADVASNRLLALAHQAGEQGVLPGHHRLHLHRLLLDLHGVHAGRFLA